METSLVLYETVDGVAILTLNDPGKRNALSRAMLTGLPSGAREAERAGLVSRVVPSERLSEETMALARQILSASSATLALGKRAFYEQVSLPRAEAYQLAEKRMVENTLAPDAHEG